MSGFERSARCFPRFLAVGSRGSKGLWRVLPLLFALLVVATPAWSDTLTDDFASGVDMTRWRVLSNQPLYGWDDSAGDVLFAKPEGGSGGLDWAGLFLDRVAYGDFDVQVDFAEASIQHLTGPVGNQVQLNLLFGGQKLSVVRSDEDAAGQNAHVYIDPPVAWIGTVVATTSTAGTLRVVRVGSLVSAYYGGTLLHSGDYNAEPVTSISMTLQNNQTEDAISVRFDDFALTADAILDLTLFDDGFETGDFSRWSTLVGGG